MNSHSLLLIVLTLLTLTVSSRFLQDECQGDYWVDPNNANQYFQCDNGVPVLRQCPVGLVFRDNVCNWPIPCPIGTYFPDTTDNTKFIQCDNGNYVVQSCALGTIWSQDVLTCVNAN